MIGSFRISIACKLALLLSVKFALATNYYVSKSGNDAAIGSQNSPWLTINKSAQMMNPGDKVIVGPGIYNETVSPARGGSNDANRITYQAAPGATVVISASEGFTNWVQHSGNTYKLTLPNTYFGSYNPYAVKSFRGFNGDLFEDHNGLVIFNDKWYTEKYSLSDFLGAKETWFVTTTSTTTEIYANFGGANPNTGDAQVAVRKQCIAPSTWGLGYITIDGFIVKNAANPYSDWPSVPERAQFGMISVNGGLKWIIENCTIMNARSIGIDIGLGCDEWAGNSNKPGRTLYSITDKYGSHIIRNNKFKFNGQSGIVGVFSWNSEILNNSFIGTGMRSEFQGNTESAAVKNHYNNEGLIQGNYFYNNGVMALWTDWGNQGMRVSQNLFVGQKWMSEALQGPLLFDNNVMINSSVHALPSKGIILAHNLILNGGVNIEVGGRDCFYYDPHTLSNGKMTLSSTSYNKAYNNIFMGFNTPTFPNNSTIANNCSNCGSAYSYKASDTSFSLQFTMNASPFIPNPLITDALIGPIPPSNQGIAVTVNQDFFGKDLKITSPVAGPFANLVNGLNNLVLWPKPASTTAIDFPNRRASPAANSFILQSSGKQIFQVNLKKWRLQVFNLDGRSVFQTTGKDEGYIDLSSLKPGLYTMRIDSDKMQQAENHLLTLNAE